MATRRIQLPDCMEFDCSDACCHYGADVLTEEYERLISNNIADRSEFSLPYKYDGETLYRTRVRNGGCVFLQPGRGCRLHATGDKPMTCRNFPGTLREARQACADGYLPCFLAINNMRAP